MTRAFLLLAALLASAPLVAAQAPAADIRLPRLVGDHMVLQREMPVALWGWATPGGAITVRLGDATARAIAGPDSLWEATLPAMPAGGPHTVTVAGAETTTLSDVLVGEVWLASGQSNMEFSLRRVDNAAAEVAGAGIPEIRLFSAPYRYALTPQTDLGGEGWQCATPETASGFSAVAFLFGRELHATLGVPVGLIDASWGGSTAEAWVSAAALSRLPDVAPLVQPYLTDAAGASAALVAENEAGLAAWRATMQTADAGLAARPTWHAAAFRTPTDWPTMPIPSRWEENGLRGVDGTVWFRRSVTLPAGWAGRDLEIRFPQLEDQDSTFVNGVFVGTQTQVGDARAYRIPASALRRGANAITVWVHDRTGFGGITGEPVLVHPDGRTLPLGGDWAYKLGARISRDVPAQPRLLWHQQPSLLFNGLVAPLERYRIRGAMWYQGESNTKRAAAYQTLLPTLIDDWRGRWHQGDFPFLVVQLPNFHRRSDDPNAASSWATLRETQLTATRLPNTALAVTIDVGDPADIHPTNKQTVAARLAASALASVYGRDVVGSGPTFVDMTPVGGAARLFFGNVGGGLVARGDTLTGFAVAGPDRRFVWATARIEGHTVIVSSPAVPEIAAVRYAWADNPAAGLYNTAGLPASPFRTDDWAVGTPAADDE